MISRPALLSLVIIFVLVAFDFAWFLVPRGQLILESVVKLRQNDSSVLRANLTDSLQKQSFLETHNKKCFSNDIFANYFKSQERVRHQDIVSKLWQPQRQASNNSSTNKKRYLVIIGDSLDRIMIQHACSFWKGNTVKLEPNRATSRPHVCHTEIWTAGYLNIFGMHRQCQPQTVKTVEPRQSLNVSTAERLVDVLPRILNLMQIPTDDPKGNTIKSRHQQNIYVQVGSNLWDLSEGCNNQVGVSDTYEQEYREGIDEIYHAVHRIFDNHFGTNKRLNIHVLWKLAAPVSLQLSTRLQQQGYGRVRTNQQRLNEILKDVVLKGAIENSNKDGHMCSGIIDWWNIVMVHMQSEKSLDYELREDGRHFSKCPSLVFFNALLEKTLDIDVDELPSCGKSRISGWAASCAHALLLFLFFSFSCMI